LIYYYAIRVAIVAFALAGVGAFQMGNWRLGVATSLLAVVNWVLLV